MELLSREFFARKPEVVARALLGKVVVRRLARGKRMAGRIVETEAYLGVNDPAAHASSGKTPRNQVLFGPPGHAYIYFTYGMHHCMNFSCQPEGFAGCVLLRALEPLDGLLQMAAARNFELSEPHTQRELKNLTSGPGRLCQALAIHRASDYGKDVVSPRSDLQVMDDGFQVKKVARTPRIGISQAMELPLRFYIAGNAFVSGNRS